MLCNMLVKFRASWVFNRGASRGMIWGVAPRPLQAGQTIIYLSGPPPQPIRPTVEDSVLFVEYEAAQSTRGLALEYHKSSLDLLFSPQAVFSEFGDSVGNIFCWAAEANPRL